MAKEDGFPHMTLRVYTVTPEGAIMNDSGVRNFAPVRMAPADYSSAFPPCRCPLHAGGRVGVRR